MNPVAASSEMTLETIASQIELERAMDEIVAAATGTVTPPITSPSGAPPNAPSRRRQGTFCGEVECDSDVEMTEAESAEQMRVSLDAIRRHLFAGDRQIGVPLSPTGDDSLVERIRSYMSDGGRTPLPASEFVSEAEEEDQDEDQQSDVEEESDAEDADDERETVEHVDEVVKPNNDQLMVSVPLWLFLTTMISFVAYMTFVIYILSWECRFPNRH